MRYCHGIYKKVFNGVGEILQYCATISEAFKEGTMVATTTTTIRLAATAVKKGKHFFSPQLNMKNYASCCASEWKGKKL